MPVPFRSSSLLAALLFLPTLLGACVSQNTLAGRDVVARAQAAAEMSIFGFPATDETAETQLERAVQYLEACRTDQIVGGDLKHLGLAWYRTGRGGYVQAFPFANISDLYTVSLFGVLTLRTVTVLKDSEGYLVGYSEFAGHWALLFNSSVRYRFAEGGGVVREETLRLGPIPIYWTVFSLGVGAQPAPAEAPPTTPPAEQPEATPETPPTAIPATPESGQPSTRQVRRVKQPAERTNPQNPNDPYDVKVAHICDYCNATVPQGKLRCPSCGKAIID